MNCASAGRVSLALPALLVAASLSCSVRLTRPAEFPPASPRLAVAPYRQAPERCGPFALAAALTFLGAPTQAGELEKALYLPEVKGTLTMDLFLAARRRGLPARQGEGDFAGVRRELAAGRPVILLLRHGPVAGAAGHFVVATGSSPASPASSPGLFLLWGDGGESWMAQEKLDEMWERSGRWMLSFAPGEGRP